MAHSDFFKITVLLYGLIFLGLAIEPLDRETWLLENILVIFAVPILILTYRKFPFSRTSYFLIFIFLIRPVDQTIDGHKGVHNIRTQKIGLRNADILADIIISNLTENARS